MMEKSAVPYDTISMNSVTTEPMFSKCCCCIPLRIGCFILGYVSLFTNSIRTLFYLGLGLYCALKTNGFDHVDDDSSSNRWTVALDHKLQEMDSHRLQMLALGLVVITICDLIWLAIHIACVVGIHKKRPGPIRVFVGFATFRLILTVAAYIYQWTAFENNTTHHIIGHSVGLCLAIYFIFVYYIYARKIEKEAVKESQIPHVHDVSYIYPTKLDKEHLVV